MAQQQNQQEQEIVIQEDAPGAAPGVSFMDLFKYLPVINQVISALTGAGPISFVVRVLGKKKRITVEDAS